MNARVEPFRAGLAIVTAVAMVVAMMLLFGSAPALGQASDPDTECDGASGYNGQWWKVQINDDGNAAGVETSELVDSDDIDFSIDDLQYSWTNESSDGFAVVRVVEKSGQTADDVHNGLWLVDDGFSDEDVASDISHITFCFAAPPQTTTSTTTTTTTVPDTTTTTVAATTTTTIPDEVAGTVITTSTTAPVVQVTTTIADEVLDTHVEAEELPFTGIDSELLVGMAVLMLMSGLLVLGVTGRRDES